jgi:hypothetical protein
MSISRQIRWVAGLLAAAVAGLALLLAGAISAMRSGHRVRRARISS